jgi:hypothetical protein
MGCIGATGRNWHFVGRALVVTLGRHVRWQVIRCERGPLAWVPDEEQIYETGLVPDRSVHTWRLSQGWRSGSNGEVAG